MKRKLQDAQCYKRRSAQFLGRCHHHRVQSIKQNTLNGNKWWWIAHDWLTVVYWTFHYLCKSAIIILYMTVTLQAFEYIWSYVVGHFQRTHSERCFHTWELNSTFLFCWLATDQPCCIWKFTASLSHTVTTVVKGVVHSLLPIRFSILDWAFRPATIQS